MDGTALASPSPSHCCQFILVVQSSSLPSHCRCPIVAVVVVVVVDVIVVVAIVVAATIAVDVTFVVVAIVATIPVFGVAAVAVALRCRHCQHCRFVKGVLVVLLGGQSKEFNQTKPRRYHPWHVDGATALGLAVGWPTALLEAWCKSMWGKK